MSRTIASTHVLPPNPTFVDFERSDGSETQWPTNTQKVVDHEGHVNFMRPIPMDESMAVKWRREVGSALAKHLKMAEGPTYVLRSWPEGYKMFDHNKGPESNPRHDVYLIGSTVAKRFRSVPEFIPHAIWLMQDPTLDRANCACKYCAKKPQREISGSLGLSSKHSPSSATPSRLGGAVRNVRNREQRDKLRPYASVRRAPKPVKLPQGQGPKQSMVRERNNDLRAAYGQSKTQFRRWFREGELLWCVLDSPIRGIMGEEDAITFWPGLVDEVKLKTEPILRSEAASAMDIDGTAATSQPRQPGDASVVIPEGNGGAEVPWTVRQYTLYKIKLLGISQTYYTADHRVLPYQAYAPSHELLQSLQDVPLEAINTSPESLAAFNPCSSAPTTAAVGTSDPHHKVRFVDAVAPYSLAIQIAASLAGFWTPTDDWDYKFSPSPPPSSYTPPVVDGQMQTLHSVMTATMLQNGALHDSISGTSSITAPVFAPSLLASIQTVTQTRYQGLWWGAERIWTDELVRLKVARRQIAPDGAENIYPPAGPSKSSVEYQTRMALADPDGSEFDAGGRGLFMRLDGLFVVEVPRENGLGSKKECRASGMLFELADEDWEEPGGDKGRGNEEAANGTGSSPHVPSADGMQGTNPLTSVPVSNSAATTNPPATNGSSQSVPPPTGKNQSPNEQLSHPILSSPFPLPDPPKGFKFRPILPPGHEAVISLTLISGRYYPGILAHPLLSSTVEHALCIAPTDGGLHESGHLWALEGLAPGFYNAVDPTRWKPSRVIMLREADKEARGGLYEHWSARAREKAEKLSVQQGPEVTPMESRAQSQAEPQPMNVDLPYNQPHQAQNSTILAPS